MAELKQYATQNKLTFPRPGVGRPSVEYLSLEAQKLANQHFKVLSNRAAQIITQKTNDGPEKLKTVFHAQRGAVGYVSEYFDERKKIMPKIS